MQHTEENKHFRLTFMNNISLRKHLCLPKKKWQCSNGIHYREKMESTREGDKLTKNVKVSEQFCCSLNHRLMF